MEGGASLHYITSRMKLKWGIREAGSQTERAEGHLPTRYSKTSVRDLSVWTMSCNVTMLACFRSFRSDTEGEKGKTVKQGKS